MVKITNPTTSMANVKDDKAFVDFLLWDDRKQGWIPLQTIEKALSYPNWDNACGFLFASVEVDQNTLNQPEPALTLELHKTSKPTKDRLQYFVDQHLAKKIEAKDILEWADRKRKEEPKTTSYKRTMFDTIISNTRSNSNKHMAITLLLKVDALILGQLNHLHLIEYALTLHRYGYHTYEGLTLQEVAALILNRLEDFSGLFKAKDFDDLLTKLELDS